MRTTNGARDPLLQLLDQMFNAAIGPKPSLQPQVLACSHLGMCVGGVAVAIAQLEEKHMRLPWLVALSFGSARAPATESGQLSPIWRARLMVTRKPETPPQRRSVLCGERAVQLQPGLLLIRLTNGIEKLDGLVVVRLSGRRRLPLKCISPTYLMGMGHLGSPAALEPLHGPVWPLAPGRSPQHEIHRRAAA